MSFSVIPESSFGAIEPGFLRKIKDYNSAYDEFCESNRFEIIHLSDCLIETHSWIARTGAITYEPSRYLMSKNTSSEEINRRFGFPAIEIDCPVLSILNAGSTNNYYHWVAQSMQSFSYLLNTQSLESNAVKYKVPMPNRLRRYQEDWLNIIVNYARSNGFSGIDMSDLFFHPHPKLVKTDLALISPTLYKPFDFRPSKFSLKSFKNVAISSLEKMNNIYGSDSPELIYISRKDSPKARGLANEDELAEALSSLGFKILTLSELSVVQQIYFFSRARLIVAPHGAGLTNIIFCNNNNCTVIEINLDNYLNNCFSAIAHAMENVENYFHYVCPVDKAIKNSNYHHSTVDIQINQFISFVKDILLE